ncbi:MAG: allantoate amidohydrolase [Candidatus Viridilinea halotolerans]|uniref:Allantoate amidohydrolase n=1 Tax=Candidatus Viridilinea halotolerans TaxID=2491704 RepID=A0A426UB74_9CHLR|nr:MAG: allantoate amidohydrolase [Candidatus Viridilinea halotolerans]
MQGKPSMHHELAATVMARCDELAAISAERHGLTRPAYTPALRAAHTLVTGWMRSAGMTVYEDAAGNLVGSYPANRSAARTLIIGSHLDTVRDAGRYDGTLGVLVAIAAIEALQRQELRMAYGIDVVAFADEEGLRFGHSFTGSLALTGRLTPEVLQINDADGVSLAEALHAFGGDPEMLAQDARRADDLVGYLEIHIEQGPLLEAQDLPLGVVSAIAGASHCQLTFSGTAGHAGTVPMELRHDALAGAAQFALAVETIARTTPDLVATVGELTPHPGASNVIAGQATLSLDVRHQDDDMRAQALHELQSRAAAIAQSRGLHLTWEDRQQWATVRMSPHFREQLRQAVQAVGYTPIELPSGAGHDAGILAEFTQAGMLFVRCQGGISHHPSEAVAVEDVAAALKVVEQFLMQV